jgi:hypothetical protein
VGRGINGSVSATYSAAMSGEVDGYINIPIVKDKLALRVTGYFDHQGGYIDNVYGEYQMPFDGHVGEAGQLPTGNPLLVSRALASCVGSPTAPARGIRRRSGRRSTMSLTSRTTTTTPNTRASARR